MNILKNDRITKIISVVFGVVFAVLLVTLVVDAASTISTDVQTDGALSVTGASTLIGLTSMTQASSTRFSVHDTAYFGGTATTSINSVGVITLTNGETISNTTSGDITLTATNVVLVGTASSSAIKIGDESVPTINGLSFGYCTFSDTSVTASSTNYFDCTTTPTIPLVLGDRVFVQATSSFDTGFIIEAASTTGVSTINVRVRNISGHLGVPDTTLGGTSLNFWAVR